jgi:tRNA dimethylallyltransferase
MRGLEVYYGTGKPLSAFHTEGTVKFGDFRPLRVWLDMDRDLLYRRIDTRLDAMVEAGLVQEVQTLLDRGVSPEIAPLRTGGYRYVVEHCLGRISLDEMRTRTAQEHRNYARRQLVWLRREFREGKVIRLDALDYKGLLETVKRHLGWETDRTRG